MNKNDALKYYEVLNVAPDSSAAEIKRQYYLQAKFWHPDHNQLPEAQDMFQRVSTAYGVLKDAHSRLIYDLLSAVYSAAEFPLIGSLKIYKNQKDKDDKALRVLKQLHVVGGHVTETKDICNIFEAAGMVFATSVANWLKGWWGKNGFLNNKKALKRNLQTVYADDADNLKLLIHNAVAYEQEKNTEMAWIYAAQADKMLQDGQCLKELLRRFMENLQYKPEKKVVIPYWNAELLKKQQMMFPAFVLIVCGLCIIGLLLRFGFFSGAKTAANDYYEERIFADGTIMPSDTIVNKIVKIDSSAASTRDLMHFDKPCKIYYGPDERYSLMMSAQINQTVRLAGYTADKQWYQIVVDSGELGYTKAKCLQKGKGNPVPFASKVYKGY